MLTQYAVIDILPSMEEKKILLRLPQDLYDRIEAIAKIERRTVTAQIVYTLERAVPANKPEPRASS